MSDKDALQTFCDAERAGQVQYAFASQSAMNARCLLTLKKNGEPRFGSIFFNVTADGFRCWPTGERQGDLEFDKTSGRLAYIEMHCPQTIF